MKKNVKSTQIASESTSSMRAIHVIGLVFIGVAVGSVCLRYPFLLDKQLRSLVIGRDPLQAVSAYDAIASRRPPPMKQLLSMLKHGNANARYGAVAVIRRLGTNGTSSSIPAVSDALGDADPNVRRGAASALAKITPVGGSVSPKLSSALKDPDAGVRLMAAKSVWHLSGSGHEAASTITNVLGQLDRTDLIFATRVLRDMGEAAKLAVPSMRSLIHHPQTEIQLAACDALASMDPSETQWTQVALAVAENNALYRGVAIEILGKHAGKIPKARECLSTLSNSSDPSTRRSVMRILEHHVAPTEPSRGRDD